ncbi:hypothetical protein HVS_11510 [Acetivibrio saccincola]|jgi:hypothetical protein|uniref:Uncharacterized protein n=1 Tax=Acetivibrio saccincola TaxID=1677857 RepID=A0A2K9EJN5_9FIRM|nr:hypothetical protein HVS_11510 [Acetivibrio saccincola]
MFFNFNDDCDLVPVTYSIRGYKKRESTFLKKFLKYFFYISTILILGVVAILGYIK